MKKKSHIKRILCILIVLALFLPVAGCRPAQSSVSVPANDIICDLPADSSMDFLKNIVYNAAYTYDVPVSSYRTVNDEVCALSDLVVPYIDINSADAAAANKEIKALYERLAKAFKTEAEGEKIQYSLSCYNTFVYGSVLSILIIVTSGGTAPAVRSYYAYNLDLETLKKVSYTEACTACGQNSDALGAKVETAILDTLSEDADDIFSEEFPKDHYVDVSMKNYNDSVRDDSIQYFIGEDNILNVVVKLEVPYGDGEFFATLPIK